MPGIDKYTMLLLHGDTVTDSSPNSVHITNQGVTISTAKSKFGGTSLRFAQNKKLTFPARYIDFGSGDWTIDWWENAEAGAKCRFCTQQTKNTGLMAGFNGTIISANSNPAAPGWDIVNGWAVMDVTVGAWVHWAIVRHGGSLSVYKNGTLKGAKPVAKPFGVDPGVNAAIGTNFNSKNSFSGHIEEFRISSIARWTENFVPPNQPYSKDLPGVPGNLKAAAESFTVTLSWSPSAFAKQYAIYRDGNRLAVTAATTYTDDTVAPLSEYRYAVEGVNDDGRGPAAEIAVTTLGYQITLPVIAAASISPHPAAMNQAATLTAVVEEKTIQLNPAYIYAGTVYSGEV